MEAKHIKNHFLENPEWEKIFLKYYPNWTPESYIENAIELFKNNGYYFKERRKYKSEKFKSILDVDLHGIATKENSDGFIFGMQGNVSTVYEQIIITAICEYEVDFSTFK